MSPSGIQDQIDELQKTIDDLSISASGVLVYVGKKTIDDYYETWGRVINDVEQRVEDLNKDIIEASGYLRVLNNGISFHRH